MPYYCLQCKRIFLETDKCKYCNCAVIKPVKINSPVNIIGSKLKGKVVKIKNVNLTVMICNEANERSLKDFKINELRKII